MALNRGLNYFASFRLPVCPSLEEIPPIYGTEDANDQEREIIACKMRRNRNLKERKQHQVMFYRIY